MEIKLIFQSHHENLESFKKNLINSPWDTFILVFDGEYQIKPSDADKPLTLRKNDIAFIPANMEFSRCVLSPVTYLNVSFTAPREHSFYASIPVGRVNIPQNQAEAILESAEYATLFPDNRELISHIIEHIFAENYLFRIRDGSRSKPFSDEVERAVRYMKNNLDKKIDMEALAEQVFLSHSGLIWKFRQELDTTPSNYLYLLRMRNAKRLLLGYSYSIAEISEMCGYSNPYYFTNSFRRHYGTSPTSFRRIHLQEK